MQQKLLDNSVNKQNACNKQATLVGLTESIPSTSKHSISNTTTNISTISTGTGTNINTNRTSTYKSIHNKAATIQFQRRIYLKSDKFYFLIMRLNLKIILLFFTVTVMIITCAVYMRCVEFTFPRELVKHWDHHLYIVNNADLLSNNNNDNNNNIITDRDNENDQDNYNDNDDNGDKRITTDLDNIECIINQEYSINCKHDLNNHEVYIPFTFLHHYFDISGIISTPSPSPLNILDVKAPSPSPSSKFLWMHSTAKINLPKTKYNSRGVFMYFENYNVEVRDRVKCISAADGVPISTQWERRGYFYPTQIAQFALSHYSKNLTEALPKVTVIENGDDKQQNWFLPRSSNYTRIWHPKFNTSIIQYETAIEFESAISLNNISSINSNNNNSNNSSFSTLDLILSVDLLLVTNSSSFMVTVKNHESKHIYRLHYIPADILLSVQNENIYYGLGSQAINRWHHITRDLHIDIQKGLALDAPKKKSSIKVKRTDLRLINLSVMGVGFFDNITLSTSDHMGHFYDAAEWFINNQDRRTGGWPNPVRRSVNGFAELKAGWLSAMGQGHAISVLARAYWHSGGDKRYLKAAALGLKPYRIYSKDGGVLALYMDKYVWYEEYPTIPASFVLNGFIYSLLGLYDLNQTASGAVSLEAGRLFNQGMESLKKMLLLYDTGSGTTYDLRHISLGIAPNLARWDYHATHVNQLLLLATIDNDPLILRTAERWKDYMFGKRAKHN